MLGKKTENIPKWFNPKLKLELGVSCMILGSRHTGKSVLQYDLLSNLAGKFDFGMAITPTEDTREQFATFMPEALIRDCDSENISTLMDLMDNVNMQRKYRGKQPKNAILILDDTAFDEKLMRSQEVTKMAMNGRHQLVTVVMTLQYLKTVKPASRKNVDFVFIRQEGDTDVRNDIRKSWFGSLTKKEFDRIFDYCTEGYGVIVRDSRMAVMHPKDWKKWIFRYVAQPIESIPKFQLFKGNCMLLGQTCTTTRAYRMGFGDRAPEDIPEEECPEPELQLVGA
jgi:hypothetical protein